MQRKTFILQILLILMMAGLVNLSSNIQVGLAENQAEDSYTVYLPVVSNPVLGWQEVGWESATGGGISLLPGLSIVSSLHINSNGVPYLAYTDFVNGVYTKIHILQWDGTIWVELTATSLSGSYEPPVVAFAPDDTPYVAWQDLSYGNGNYEIYIRHWDGNHWVEVGPGSASGGGISNDLTVSALPTIAFGLDGNPYVAWLNYSDTAGSDIYIRRWDGSSWIEVGVGSASGGGLSNDAGTSWEPSMAIAPDGTPYVTWIDITGSLSNIYVRRWDGSSWAEVGPGSASDGGISNTGHTYSPAIAIASDGTPYISWEDNDMNSGVIYIRQWNGDTWAEVGPGSASGAGVSGWESLEPSLAISPDGFPYLAWRSWEISTSDNHEIYVRQWDGTSWVEVGTGSASGGGISNIPGYSVGAFITIASDGTPYVAWNDDNSGAYQVFMRTWNGSEWAELREGDASGLGITGGWFHNAVNPSVDISSLGRPFVAWQTEFSGEIYVRAWNGYYWEPLSSNFATVEDISQTDSYSSYPSIAVTPYGVPYVAWQEDNAGNTEIYVRTWNGSSWVEAGAGSASEGGISNSPGASQFPVLRSDALGQLTLAWQDDSSGQAEIYVRHWDGSSWSEVGAGSTTGGGISNTPGASRHPALALASDGTPYLAWEEEDASAQTDIYLRHWDGSAWVEFGSGSASGSGISHTPGNSLNPTLAVTPNGLVFVAWEDDSSGDSQIYILEGDGMTWAEIGVGSASGGGISLSGSATTPSLALGYNGFPLIAWSASDAGVCCEIYALRWGGSHWIEVGESSASLGGISGTSGVSTHPMLVVPPSGNAFVVWEDNDPGNIAIYIRRYILSPFPE